MQTTPQSVATVPVTGRKRNSLGLRLWHWSSALVIAGLLITILFLYVVINTAELGPAFQDVLSKAGITITAEQAKALRRIVSHRIWDWHIGLGVALSGLLAGRVALEFAQHGSQRFGAKLGQARLLFRQRGPDLQDARHSLLVKYS